jgi:predicted enzyme related to lactoylglutathione lyase
MKTILNNHKNMNYFQSLLKSSIITFCVIILSLTSNDSKAQFYEFYNSIDGAVTNEVNVQPGENFTLLVGVNTDGLVTGVTASLEYDPTGLQVDGPIVDLAPPELNVSFGNIIDNTQGNVLLSKVSFGATPLTGSFEFMEVTFEVSQGVVPGTSFNIDHIMQQPGIANYSEIAYSGTNFLTAAPSLTVNVVEEPEIDIAFNDEVLGFNSELEYCANENITVTLDGVVSGTAPFELEWEVDGNQFSEDDASVGFEFFNGTLSPGTHTVELISIIDDNGIAVSNPSSIYTAEITVLEEPDINILINNEVAGYNSNFSFCQGATITASLQELSGLAPYDLEWTLDGTADSANDVANGGTLFSGTLSPGTHTVILTSLTDDNGCQLVDLNGYQTEIYVNEAPVASGSLAATDIEACSAPAAATSVAGLEALNGNLEISDVVTADGDLVVTSSDDVSGTCPTTVTRTYTITDECGATLEVVHEIEYDDTTAPVFTGLPSDVTVECASDVPAMTSLNWTDDCDGSGSVSGSDSSVSGNGVYETITRTWSYTDGCGNASSVSQIITVNDGDSPVLDGVTSSIDGECLNGGNFVWTVDASDDNLVSLEIDHSLEGSLPEFSVYADSGDPYGGDQADFTAAGVTVNYNDASQSWTIDFGAAITQQIIDNGGITFYTVLEDCNGNELGSMSPTGPDNTFAYDLDNSAPVLENVSASANGECLNGGNFVWTVDASDDNLHSLEVDHSLQNVLPEFTVYADAGNVYGSAQAATDFADAGVSVVYNDATQTWAIDFGPAVTQQFIDNGGITFYTVLEDCNGNELGSMSPTGSDNTFAYDLDDEAPVLEDVSASAVGECLNGGNFVWTVDASDDNLVSLEVDHSLQNVLPEFTIYADGGDPYGSQQAEDDFTNAGVSVVYNDANQTWTIDFGPTVTQQLIANGGITFYTVLEDCNGNELGSMSPTGPDNTFAYDLDDEAPVAVCQDIQVELDVNGSAIITAAQINNGSVDNCGIASVSIDNTTFDCSNLGQNTVTLTVTDLSGNEATCQSTVTVIDVEAPVVTCPGDQTVSLSANCELILPDYIALASATDACGSVVLTQSPAAGTAISSLTEVTITATDASGNSSACTFNAIPEEDTENPVAVCNDFTVQLDINGSATITPQDIDGGSTDNCGIASYDLSQSTFDCTDISVGGAPANAIWLNEIHYDNDGGDTGEFVEVVANFDASAYDVVFYNGSNGEEYDLSILGSPVATESGYNIYTVFESGIQNGAPDGLAIVDESDNVIEFISYEGSFTATDGPASGMTSTDIGISEAGSTPIGESLQKTGAGSTGGDFTWTGPAAESPGSLNAGQSISAGGGTEVTLTVTDENGNTNSCTATVTVEDNIAPNAVCQDLTLSLLDGMATLDPAQIDGGSTDNCAIASISASQTEFDCSHSGENTVTLTVEDESGNVSTCDAIVTIEGEPDADICFNGQVAGFGDTFNYCEGQNIDVTLCTAISGVTPFEVCYTVDGVDEVCVSVNESESIFTGILDPGTYEIQITSITSAEGCELQIPGPYSATVVVGETACSTETVTACESYEWNGTVYTESGVYTNETTVEGCTTIDTLELTINPLPDANFTFNGALAGYNAEFSYCEGTEVNVAMSEILSGTGPFTITWTVDGGAEQTASVEEGETFATELLEPGTYEIDLTEITDANGCTFEDTEELYGATVTINEEPDVNILFNGAVAGYGDEFNFCEGQNILVTVEALSGTAPFDLTWEIDGDSESATGVENGDELFNGTLESGTYTVALTALSDDNCSLSDTSPYSVTINVSETAGSTETVTACVSYEWNGTTYTESGVYTNETTVDGCTTIDTLELTINEEPDANILFNGVVAGFNSDFTYCFDEIITATVEGVAGTAPYDLEWTLDGTADSADDVANGGTFFSGTLAPGTHTVILTSLVDANGCELSDYTGYQAEITVNEEPDANILFNGVVAGYGDEFNYCIDQNVIVSLEGISGEAPYSAEWTVNGDANAALLGEGGELFNGTLPEGTYEVQLTSLVDANGCELSDTTPYGATVIVGDSEAPSAVCQNITVELDENGQATISADDLDGGSSDNCGIEEISISQSDFSCADIGENTVTLTVLDLGGNSASCDATVTVVDVDAPVFTFVPADLTISCEDEVPFEMATATDNCSVEVTSEDVIEDDSCPSDYVLERVFTATDPIGNEVTASQFITVEDNEAPTLNEQPEDLVLDCFDEVPEPAAVTASDNCDPNVAVTFEETIVGNEPTAGSESDCVLSDPMNGTVDWSMILFNLGGQEESTYSTVEVNWIVYPDQGSGQTAEIEGTVVSDDNPNAGWVIHVNLENGVDWDTWSNQPFQTDYKDDFGYGVNDFEDWTYYLVNSTGSYLEGWGDYAGSYLEVSHAPNDQYFAFQEGVGANNTGPNNGIGGWFHYEGTFFDAANEVNETVNSLGDFSFDMDCCPDYTIVRTWTVVDCAGNETTHSQEISFEDLPDVDTCPADLNNDGYIGTEDLLLLLSNYDCESNCIYDISGDDMTGTNDLLIMLSVFGSFCDE